MTAGNHDLARLRNRSTATGVIFSARRYQNAFHSVTMRGEKPWQKEQP
jgi:hypothetical protein